MVQIKWSPGWFPIANRETMQLAVAHGWFVALEQHPRNSFTLPPIDMEHGRGWFHREFEGEKAEKGPKNKKAAEQIGRIGWKIFACFMDPLPAPQNMGLISRVNITHCPADSHGTPNNKRFDWESPLEEVVFEVPCETTSSKKIFGTPNSPKLTRLLGMENLRFWLFFGVV